MLPLILLACAIALFSGFLLLLRYETKRGARFFPEARAALDRDAREVGRAVRDADAGAYLMRAASRGFERLVHDAAHLTLLAVRAAERGLSSAVRALRRRRAETLQKPSEPSAFATTMKDFKEELRSSQAGAPNTKDEESKPAP